MEDFFPYRQEAPFLTQNQASPFGGYLLYPNFFKTPPNTSRKKKVHFLEEWSPFELSNFFHV